MQITYRVAPHVPVTRPSGRGSVGRPGPRAVRAQASSASSDSRPDRATYVRRRLAALVFLVTLVLSVGLAARHGLAARGDGPASTSTGGRATSSAELAAITGVQADGTYVVQPGDSMWTIAARVHRGSDLAGYVDALVALHGGSAIAPGERIRLP